MSVSAALLLVAFRVNAQQASVPSSELALGTPTSTAASSEAEAAKPPARPPDAHGERPAQSAVYGQFFGSAVMVGMGFSYRPLASLAFDAGLGWFTWTPERSTVTGLTPSLSVSGLLGRHNHSFELGAGAAVVITTESGNEEVTPVLGPHLGYRYQPVDGGLFVRATVHGVVNFGNGNLTPWPGVSLGGTWNL